MNRPTRYEGSCLCKAVRVAIDLTGAGVGICHCSMCRKWSGGPLMAVDTHDPLSVDGEEHVTVFDSSEWAERGFCSRCGTHLFYRLKSGGMYAVPVGLLDADDPWVLEQEIFVDQKPGYYDFANEMQRLTGAEVFALHEPSAD